MKKIVFSFIMFIYTSSLVAQEVIRVPSDFLHQSTPVLIQKPSSFNPSKEYPLVFLLHGYSEDFNQWSQIVDLQEFADKFQMILVCPEGYESFYLNSPERKYSQYESFFFKELVPVLQQSYPIDQQNIFISGLSMGGYGAIRLLINHPSFFNTAASTSGALEFDYDTFKQASQQFFASDRLVEDLASIVGKDSANNWSDWSISTLMKTHPDFEKEFFLDCGLQDPLLGHTQCIIDLAAEKNIPVTYRLGPGGHEADYWKKAFPYHLVFFMQHLR